MNDQEPADIVYIRTQAHWKALSHPLRLGIVRLLRQKAMTNEELAHTLGVASGKLYFHTKQLLDAGLIRLVGTRQKRAITEKLYRATGKSFRVAPLLDGEESETIGMGEIESAVYLLQNTLREYPALFSAENHLIDHSLPLLPPAKAEEILHKLRALIQDAMASKTTAPDAVPMALTVLWYPLPGPIRMTEEHNSSEDDREG